MSVLAAASSDDAARRPGGGRKAHLAFKISILAQFQRTHNIDVTLPISKKLEKPFFITWNEIDTTRAHNLRVVNRTLCYNIQSALPFAKILFLN